MASPGNAATQRRAERDRRRRLEAEVLAEETTRGAPLTPSSSTPRASQPVAPRRTRSHPNNAQGPASSASRANTRGDRAVRFNDVHEVIRIPQARGDAEFDNGDDDARAIIPSQGRSIQATGNKNNNNDNDNSNNEIDRHDPATASFSNSLSLVNGLFVAAGAVVESLSWSKTETHNHYYQSSSPTPIANDRHDEPAPLRRSRIPLAAVYATCSRSQKLVILLVIVAVGIVILCICHYVVSAYRLAVDVVTWPWIQAQSLLSTGAALAGWASAAVTTPWGRTKEHIVMATTSTHHGDQVQNPAVPVVVAVAPLIPRLSSITGVVSQADFVVRDMAGLLPGSHSLAASQVPSTLRRLRDVQDKTETTWVHGVRTHLRIARQLSARLRGLQSEIDWIGASWLGWLVPCDSPLVGRWWCSGLRGRIVAGLVEVEDLVLMAKQAREKHVTKEALVVTARDVRELVCRLYTQNVLSGLEEEVTRRISASDKERQQQQQHGDDNSNDRNDNDDGGESTAEMDRLHRAHTRIGDQRSGLRLNCLGAKQTPADAELVRRSLAVAVGTMEGVLDKLHWARYGVENRKGRLEDGIMAGLEALGVVEEELYRCSDAVR